jgi:hypothetical protein
VFERETQVVPKEKERAVEESINVGSQAAEKKPSPKSSEYPVQRSFAAWGKRLEVLELGVRWYTVVYILDVYIGLSPLNCHNQVVNSNYILQHEEDSSRKHVRRVLLAFALTRVPDILPAGYVTI